MAVKSTRPENRYRTLYGTNAERLALDTSDLVPTTRFVDIDTGDEYQWSGTIWSKSATGGVSNSHITNQEVDVASIQDSDSFAITGIGATVQINNLDIFDEFAFDIAGAGVTDTISLTTSKDGINFSGTKKLCLNTNTGNAAASVDMPVGDYVVPINCKSILVTMSGATDTHQFTWAARNAGRRRME